MKTEEITMQDVRDIFADYLEQNNNVEVVEILKMGYFTIFDGSRMSDRTMLNVKAAPDPEALARQLIWLETSEYFYALDHSGKDPWDCDEAFINEIYYRVMPHLMKLPMEWRDEIVNFFSEPGEAEA